MACWYSHHYGHSIAQAQAQAVQAYANQAAVAGAANAAAAEGAAAAAAAAEDVQAAARENNNKHEASDEAPPRTAAPLARWWQDPAQVPADYFTNVECFNAVMVVLSCFWPGL